MIRFAALSRQNDYSNAGRMIANEYSNIQQAIANNKVNYSKIFETGMKTEAAKKKAAIDNAAKVMTAGIDASAKINDVKSSVRIAEIKNNANRKAGKLAAINQLTQGLTSSSKMKRPLAPSNIDYDSLIKEAQEKVDATRKKMEENIDKDNPTNNTSAGDDPGTTEPGSTTTGGPKPGKETTGANTSQGTKTAGGKPAMRYMELLTNNGMSDVQAAALVGHLKVESDDFKADTEYAPNAYGTRGRGHLQWTDTSKKSRRRTNFEQYASSNNLDPTSWEANSGFLLSEMQGNYGNHWTGGSSLDGFKGTNSLESASAYLQNNYIRPGVPHTDRRLSGAQTVLDQWRQANS